MIPFYATRQKDGLSFAIDLEAPIAASDPDTMTAAITAMIERVTTSSMSVNPRPDTWEEQRFMFAV